MIITKKRRLSSAINAIKPLITIYPDAINAVNPTTSNVYFQRKMFVQIAIIKREIINEIPIIIIIIINIIFCIFK